MGKDIANYSQYSMNITLLTLKWSPDECNAVAEFRLPRRGLHATSASKSTNLQIYFES